MYAENYFVALHCILKLFIPPSLRMGALIQAASGMIKEAASLAVNEAAFKSVNEAALLVVRQHH